MRPIFCHTVVKVADSADSAGFDSFSRALASGEGADPTFCNGRHRCMTRVLQASQRFCNFEEKHCATIFGRQEYKRNVRKSKVLGFTTSTGKMLFVLCPQPWCAEAFARIVRRRVGPFFKAAYPEKRLIRVLLDSEPLLHAGPAKEALAEFGIEALPDWPKYSPDLNPQENVWGWVEEALRAEEERADSYADFCKKLFLVARRYPARSLIASMHERVQAVLASKGGMTRY